VKVTTPTLAGATILSQIGKTSHSNLQEIGVKKISLTLNIRSSLRQIRHTFG
jgi:hypothetical protein